MPITESVTAATKNAVLLPRKMIAGASLTYSPVRQKIPYEIFGGAFRKNTPSKGIIVAGGYAAHILTGFERDENADVDIFSYGQSLDEMIESLYLFPMAASTGVRHGNLFEWKYANTKFQFILRQFATIDDIFAAFDLPCCCVGFDATNIYYSANGYQAIKTGIISIDWTNRTSFNDNRLVKYLNRGFGIACEKITVTLSDKSSKTDGTYLRSRIEFCDKDKRLELRGNFYITGLNGIYTLSKGSFTECINSGDNVLDYVKRFTATFTEDELFDAFNKTLYSRAAALSYGQNIKDITETLMREFPKFTTQTLPAAVMDWLKVYNKPVKDSYLKYMRRPEWFELYYDFCVAHSKSKSKISLPSPLEFQRAMMNIFSSKNESKSSIVEKETVKKPMLANESDDESDVEEEIPKAVQLKDIREKELEKLRKQIEEDWIEDATTE